MSFQFNFQHDEDCDVPHEETSDILSTDTLKLECKPAMEIMMNEKQTVNNLTTDNKYSTRTGEEIVYICSDDIEKKLQSDVTRVNDQHSDLVPNVYEGGMTIWECSIDLVDYLCGVDVCDQRVIELGCGVALPGLYTVRKDAACVHFQDYNEDVIINVTIPNVQLNTKNTEHQLDPLKQSAVNQSIEINKSRDYRFFSGDWSSLVETLKGKEEELHTCHKYDLILTSETIYSPNSYLKLHNILEALLKPTGVIYLAAKTHYFGVGGGTRDFEEFIKKQNVFTSSVVKTITAGVNREILQLTFKSSCTEKVS